MCSLKVIAMRRGGDERLHFISLLIAFLLQHKDPLLAMMGLESNLVLGGWKHEGTSSTDSISLVSLPLNRTK